MNLFWFYFGPKQPFLNIFLPARLSIFHYLRPKYRSATSQWSDISSIAAVTSFLSSSLQPDFRIQRKHSSSPYINAIGSRLSRNLPGTFTLMMKTYALYLEIAKFFRESLDIWVKHTRNYKFISMIQIWGAIYRNIEKTRKCPKFQ